MVKNRLYSFKYAFAGIWTAFKDQPNIKIHFLIAAATLAAGIYFKISHYEWLALTLTIGLVITMELTNTAIEEIVDSFIDGIHPSAKKAKDVAAGAVLVSSIMAVAIGMIIFLPHILR